MSFVTHLDSKYIFENLVTRMNEYRGRILATTHNPVISVIPDIRNYIYVERNNSTYSLYQSTDYLFGTLKDLTTSETKNTKNMLIDVTEGTEEAFNRRGDKYEIK